jgi:hypothetical protein
LIHVTCDLTFDELAEAVDDDSVIDDLGGEYLLSASIKVADNVMLTIAAPKVTWVKISNEGHHGDDDSRSGGEQQQYNIDVRGGLMDMNGIKMTSWDPDKGRVVEQDHEDGSIPRPFIHYHDSEGGSTIQNSELSHMGYAGGIRRGFSIVGDDSAILSS